MTIKPLSDRELAVVYRLQAGISMTCIASLLDLSIKTVSTYGLRAAIKLGFTNTKDMLKHAQLDPVVMKSEGGIKILGKNYAYYQPYIASDNVPLVIVTGLRK